MGGEINEILQTCKSKGEDVSLLNWAQHHEEVFGE
jgi:hypothetical protein